VHPLKSLLVAVAVISAAVTVVFAPLPAAALQAQQGASCATNGTTAAAAQASGGQNLICTSGTWQYVPYQFGNSAASCPGTGNASLGMVQWTGSLFQGCEPSGWTTFSPCAVHQGYSFGFNYSIGYVQDFWGIWGDGTYIYEGVGNGSTAYIFAFTFNTNTHVWTQVGYTTTAGPIQAIWGDGTYIYTVENGTTYYGGTSGLEAFTFNGSAFTLKGSYSTSMIGDFLTGTTTGGTKLFVADDTNGLKVFTFSGSAFTLKATALPSGGKITNSYYDGTYVYANDYNNGKFDAYTYSGTTLTLKGTGNSSQGPSSANFFWGDGTYLYATYNGYGMEAYSFNGTTFSFKTYVDPISTYEGAIYTKNGSIYVASPGGGADIRVFSYNGTAFTYKGTIPNDYSGMLMWSDGSYLYFPDGGGGHQVYDLTAFPLCN
jgi:hypothetical protein